MSDDYYARRRSEAFVFEDKDTVAAYRHRLPYDGEILGKLLGLMTGPHRRVLDVGCGTGEIARAVVGQVDQVDAVDPSAEMLDAARSSPGGEHPRLRWICSKIEAARIDPPYDLVVAGSSLHWIDCGVAMPILSRSLRSGGVMVLMGSGLHNSPWLKEQLGLTASYCPATAEKPHRPLVEDLEDRGLFETRGQASSAPVVYHRTVDEYVEAYTTVNVFRRNMDTDRHRRLLHELKELLAGYSKDGVLTIEAFCHLAWGVPGLGHVMFDSAKGPRLTDP